MFSPQFEALTREAGIIAAAIGQGINGISNATYAEKGYYHYAFFNLSIAYERLGKLIFVLDHLLNCGSYPSDAELRALGHKLTALVDKTKEIRTRRGINCEAFPDDTISLNIIETLSEFATATRYYNLDYLVGGKSRSMKEPLAAWYESVSKPILAKHYHPKKRAADEAKARLIGSLLDEISSVRHTAEDGTDITSWTAGALETAKINTLQKYSRMYCLRIVRALAALLEALQYEVMKGRNEIPYLSDFFRIFHNEDSYFLSRKRWDPYKP